MTIVDADGNRIGMGQHRDYGRSPTSPRRDYGRRELHVRMDPCDLGRLMHMADRTGINRAELARRGIGLILDGYPAFTPDQHDWLLRLAAVNDLSGDPAKILAQLLDHLMHRYPYPHRLISP